MARLHAQREMQCNVTWQVLRTGTLPRYSPMGGWESVVGVEDNLAKLDAYVQRGYYINYPEYQRRLYRVRSLLLAVLRDYRDRGDKDTLVYQMVLKKLHYYPNPGVLRAIGTNGWIGAAKRDLQHLLKEDPDMYNNVRREVAAHLKRAQGDQVAMQTFYDLMQEVSNGS